jgi:hypothetical protein
MTRMANMTRRTRLVGRTPCSKHGMRHREARTSERAKSLFLEQ